MSIHELTYCGRLLAREGLKIAFVESASAGFLSYSFSMLENSGAVLVGGLVCYDARVKEEILKIDSGLIRKYTPESAEVTRAMAYQFRQFIEADIIVALTGLTTDGGSETPEKPVGTMFLHVIFPWGEKGYRRHFDGTPQEILDLTLLETVKLISNEIESPERLHIGK